MRLLHVRIPLCFLTPLLTVVCLSATPMDMLAQTAPHTRSAVVPPSTLVQQALSDVQSTTSGLNISHWKTSRDMRKTAQRNVDSIKSDLGAQMPQLIARADGSPDSVLRSFELYRNIDALYDVLLRVSRTADEGAPRTDAEAIAASLERLERARTALARQISRVAREREARLAALERAVTMPPSPGTNHSDAPHEAVVVDGPVSAAHHRTTRHTTRRKAAKPNTSHPK